MNDFSWLHFSDLHLSDGIDTLMAQRALLQKLASEQFHCNYIFLTGDIVNRGEYTAESINNIQKIIGTINSNGNKARILWAVGNHDINRSICERNELIKKIRSSGGGQLQICLKKDYDRNTLTSVGMADYSSHYDSVCGENLLALGDTHTLVSDLNLNVVVLNTCLTSFDNQDENNLYLINKELIEIFDRVDKSKPTFVIGHHGREFLARSEAGKLEDLFNNVVDIYLCGHSHRLGYSTLDNTDNNVIELTCGGGIPDDYSKCSFFYGQFIGSASEVKLTPYSYSEKGNHEWNKDYTLHRKLKENKSFSLNRLVVPIPEYVHERGALVQNYMRVSNARFGFSLEIPNTWGVDHNVADNGDGFKIYCPNNAIEMAAFGSHSISVFGLYDYMELMKKSYPIIKSFAYNNGCLGYAMYSKKEVKFTMFNESIDISYYINFENDLSWFENNDNFISDIARTLSFN